MDPIVLILDHILQVPHIRAFDKPPPLIYVNNVLLFYVI